MTKIEQLEVKLNEAAALLGEVRAEQRAAVDAAVLAERQRINGAIDAAQGQVPWRVSLPANNDAGRNYDGDYASVAPLDYVRRFVPEATDVGALTFQTIASEEPTPITLSVRTYDTTTTEWSEPAAETYHWLPA